MQHDVESVEPGILETPHTQVDRNISISAEMWDGMQQSALDSASIARGSCIRQIC